MDSIQTRNLHANYATSVDPGIYDLNRYLDEKFGGNFETYLNKSVVNALQNDPTLKSSINTTVDSVVGTKVSTLETNVSSLSSYQLSGSGIPENRVSAPVGAEYVDTAVTNGAVKWIKYAGTGNTGWRVLYGDTGWREVTKIFSDAATAQSKTWTMRIWFRRFGETIAVRMNSSQNESFSNLVVNLPDGFRFSNGAGSISGLNGGDPGLRWDKGGASPLFIYVGGQHVRGETHMFTSSLYYPLGALPGTASEPV